MPIAAALLTSGSSSVDGTSFNTASVAPTAQRLVLVFVHTRNSSVSPAAPALSGAGLTWTSVAGYVYDDTAGNRGRIDVFRANSGGSPGSGALTISFGAETEHICQWSVIEFNGVDLSGGDAGAIVQTKTGILDPTAANNGSLAFANPLGTNNRPVAGWGADINEAVAPRASWTELSEDKGTLPVATLETQWRSDSNEQTFSATWTTAALWGAIGVEVKASVAVGQASETDTALPLAKRNAVGQPSETDTSQQVKAVRSKAVAQASEMDTAQVIAAKKRHMVAMVAEKDEALAVVAAPFVEPFNVIIRSARPFGTVLHQIVSPEGEADWPTIGDWEANESAPGGLGPATGRVDADRIRKKWEVYRAGSIWRSYHAETGEVIHASELREPSIESGVGLLQGRGWADLAERQIERILYQTRDTSPWFLTQRDVSVSVGVWSFVQGVGDGAGLTFRRAPVAVSNQVVVTYWLPGVTPKRLAFRSFVSTLADLSCVVMFEIYGGVFATHTPKSAPWTFYRSGELHTPSGGGFPVWADHVVDLTTDEDGFERDIDFIQINVFDQLFNSGRATLQLTNVRINDAAPGDIFRASHLVKDLAGRLGIGIGRVVGAGPNILPLDIVQGTYGDGFDLAAIHTDRPVVIRDSGTQPLIYFEPWDDHVWTIVSERQPFDPIGLERYDAVFVPFQRAAVEVDAGGGLSVAQTGSTQAFVKAFAKTRLPVSRTYGPLPLENAMPDEEAARGLGESAADLLVQQRYGGSPSLGTVRDRNGDERSPYLVRAGHSLYHAPTDLGGLRLAALRKTYTSVDAQLEESLTGLARMIARRERRLKLKASVTR